MIKQEKFLTLYEPVHERFERFCRARVYGNLDFRDLINESLLVAFEKFEQLRSKEAFLSFLIGVSIRILANNNRKKQEEYVYEINQFEYLKDVGITPDNQADIHFLYQALSLLSEEQRESIILFELSGFSIKEIAEIHQVGESAVKQRLKRGREKLAELLTHTSSLKKGELNYE